MRLIDADELEMPFAKVLQKAVHSTIGWSLGRMYDECRSVIDKALTVDAELVQHGKWVVKTDENGFAKWNSCSNCGSSSRKFNYCPMCGENLKKDPVGTEIIWNERSIEELWGLENNET